MHRFSFDAQCAEKQWLAQYHKPDCADHGVDEGDWSKDHASIGPSWLWTARKRQGGWISVSRFKDVARQCPCVLRNCESPYLKWTPQHSRARATYQERRNPKSEVERTWPRQVRTLFARLRTGHSKELRQYRYMIEKDDEPTCQECDDDEETIEHILCHCPALERIRRLIFEEPPTMAQMTKQPEMCRKFRYNSVSASCE